MSGKSLGNGQLHCTVFLAGSVPDTRSQDIHLLVEYQTRLTRLLVNSFSARFAFL